MTKIKNEVGYIQLISVHLNDYFAKFKNDQDLLQLIAGQAKEKKKGNVHNRIAAEPLGVATISAPGVPDRQIERITEKKARLLANSQPGAVLHWTPGEAD